MFERLITYHKKVLFKRPYSYLSTTTNLGKDKYCVVLLNLSFFFLKWINLNNYDNYYYLYFILVR